MPKTKPVSLSHLEEFEQVIKDVHTLEASGVFSALATSSDGLSEAEVKTRQTRFGPNAIRRVKQASIILKFFANFSHLMAILLWIGGAVAFLARMPELGIAIWCVNLLNGAFSFWQEFKAEKATEALQRLMPRSVRVIRERREQEIPAEDLIPGDLMILGEGTHISADARLVQAVELQVDQSVLTGESHPVRKTADSLAMSSSNRSESGNLVFAGANVVSGSGKAVVIATGMSTEFGRIAHLTQSVREELSPLQREMRVVTRIVTVVAIVAGVLCFLLSVFMTRMNAAEGFLFALGMIVAFVPEGLLPTVTLALAVGVQRMAGRNALVKRLSSVETLGCTTVICTDKTGTLTQNEMTVTAIGLPGRSFTVTGVGYAPEGHILEGDRPAGVDLDLRQLLVASALCNDARLLEPAQNHEGWSILGDPTEAALLVAAAKAGIDLALETRRALRVREFPFDSRRKRMSTIHRIMPAAAQGMITVYAKGAPSEIIRQCGFIRKDGADIPLDDAIRSDVMASVDAYASDGLRVLGIAMRTMGEIPVARSGTYLQELKQDTVEQGLTFLGLMAMMDPPRPEVAEAARKCHDAGIRTIMITGDYGLTAQTIARRIGFIRQPDTRICAGADLDGMDDEAVKAILQGEVIFARMTPEHKLRIVRNLQECGQVVAVTGDGVNDAPALKKADIGVAMGLTGTDVAKEAADMILTDDNFASIVNAVEEGRAVYANVKKFTSYIFTSNSPEAIPFILFALSGGRIPLALTIMQILSIDLGTDMVPALALGAERPEPDVMKKPPRSRSDHVISRFMLWRAYGWLGILQGAAAMAAFYFQYWTNGYRGVWIDLPSDGVLYQSATTMTLAAVVTTQIGNLFAQRTDYASAIRVGWFSNALIWWGIATEVVIVLALIYLPYAQSLFGTHPFAFSNWVFLVALTPLLFVADEIRKLVHRARMKDEL